MPLQAQRPLQQLLRVLQAAWATAGRRKRQRCCCRHAHYWRVRFAQAGPRLSRALCACSERAWRASDGCRGCKQDHPTSKCPTGAAGALDGAAAALLASPLCASGHPASSGCSLLLAHALGDAARAEAAARQLGGSLPDASPQGSWAAGAALAVAHWRAASGQGEEARGLYERAAEVAAAAAQAATPGAGSGPVPLLSSRIALEVRADALLGVAQVGMVWDEHGVGRGLHQLGMGAAPSCAPLTAWGEGGRARQLALFKAALICTHAAVCNPCARRHSHTLMHSNMLAGATCARALSSGKQAGE